ncbi:elongin A, like isoform X2 [Pristis pectinata]|uniref:elongin A, like isoform X2 n=1 Tax=Pristis pectinata TaxID=685728 RepID=UPI00223E1BB6|nr:elongin A, like isoform X2 [Pristis pectinata]
MAEEVMQDVLYLKERLLKVTDPAKILKLLKRLQDLNITVDVLVETGIGKTVNGFRKNKAVGGTAKKLVYQWRKLIPEQASRDNREQNEGRGGDNRDHAKKKPRMENASKSSESSHAETQHVNKCARLLNDDKSPKKQEGAVCYQQPPVDSPVQLKTNESKSSRKERKDRHCASKSNLSPDQRFFKCGKSTSSHKKRSTSSRKGEKPAGNGEITKDQDKRESSAGVSAASCSNDKERSHSGKSTRKNGEKKKNKSVDKTKHSNLACKADEYSEKKKGSLGSDKPQDISHAPKQSIKGGQMKDLSDCRNEEFEKPVMTFESYLNYEEPKRKARRHHKSKNLPILEKDGCSKLTSPTKKGIDGCRSSQRKENKSKGDAIKRDQSDEDIWTEEANKKVKVDINTLLDIPLPKFLPDVTEVPFDFLSTSPIKKLAPNVSENTVEFTGRRLNCKMQVYSGCKTTNILKMMSLYEQCIRVLQNNIDSIHEVGGVPFEIIEPVLDRCTSEQLCRIEDCNPSFIEQTDHLWMKHCKKDFKSEQPQEYESWRELYLRLYDEREQKLKILTQSISSAHANKPKGRQVKLAYVNTSAKPPRGIVRQQGKHGTAGTAFHSSSKQRMKSSGSTDWSSSTGGSGSSDGTRSGSSNVVASSHSGPDAKRQVKKIAPMMAKSLRAFKNRLGPR